MGAIDIGLEFGYGFINRIIDCNFVGSSVGVKSANQANSVIISNNNFEGQSFAAIIVGNSVGGMIIVSMNMPLVTLLKLIPRLWSTLVGGQRDGRYRWARDYNIRDDKHYNNKVQLHRYHKRRSRHLRGPDARQCWSTYIWATSAQAEVRPESDRRKW